MLAGENYVKYFSDRTFLNLIKMNIRSYFDL